MNDNDIDLLISNKTRKEILKITIEFVETVLPICNKYEKFNKYMNSSKKVLKKDSRRNRRLTKEISKPRDLVDFLRPLNTMTYATEACKYLAYYAASDFKMYANLAIYYSVKCNPKLKNKGIR